MQICDTKSFDIKFKNISEMQTSYRHKVCVCYINIESDDYTFV